MQNINLVDWKTRRANVESIMVCLTAFVAVALAFLLYVLIQYYLHSKITTLETSISATQQETLELSSYVSQADHLLNKFSKVNASLNEITQIYDSRFAGSLLFEELAKATVPGTEITLLMYRNQKLKIRGMSETNEAIRQFLDRLQVSGYFSNENILKLQMNTTSEFLRQSTKQKIIFEVTYDCHFKLASNEDLKNE